MSFRYRLEADGTTVGSFSTAVCDWRVGDEFLDGEHRRWTIVNITSLDDPDDLKVVGAFEVMPLKLAEQ